MSGLAGPSTRAGDAPLSMAARARSSHVAIRRMQASVTSLAECGVPTIAAIHGYCIGGGVDLAAACDIRLASADATFSVRETKVAIVADLGSLQRLPAIIGQGHLAELAYTGKDITAERAATIGLVNHVADDADGVRQEARCPGRRDRGQLTTGRAGDQGGARRRPGSIGGRRSRLRGRLERRVPGLGRSGRSHGRLHGEAAGGVHRSLARPNACGATSGPRGAPPDRPPRGPRPQCRDRRR